MAMTPQCRAAVQARAGRALSAADLAGIDARLSGTARRLAVTDPNWRAMSADQRTLQAATVAMRDMQAEAARKIANVQRQALATAATDARTARHRQLLGGGASRALVEDMVQTGHYVEGVKREALSQLMPLLDAVGSGEGASLGRRGLMFLFDAQNPQMTQDLVAEIFANGQGGTGNRIAQAGAKAWLDTIEQLRQRFNAAGGDVGRLAYGYLPQPHDAARVRNAGRDAWANRTLPLLDRRQYLHEDGSRMSDAEVLDFLRASWETLATDGLNKLTPGAFRGTGARANRGGESRQIHFKDGGSYAAYLADFGRGSMYDAIVGHIGAMAKDIGLIERYGPNPEAQFRLQSDLAERADMGLKRAFGFKPQAYWNLLSGATGSPETAWVASLGQHVRNVMVFAKLGGAVISSVTDLGTLHVTAGYNKLPYWDLWRNTASLASKDSRDFLTTHGVIAESMAGDLNRWAGEHVLNNWSGRIANATMRLSLMNAWTDTLRRGFSITMMQGLGRLSGKRWADLSDWDRTHMERKGITANDWAVINLAQLTDHNGRKFLTPEAIAASGDPRAAEVTAKVLGLITDESEFAVINPDMATRAWSTGGLQAGTAPGELARSVMQFKSFPIAMISRHWRRMLEGDRGLDGAPLVANKAAYAAALLLTSTALGAIAFQAKQLVQGKDPVDMTTGKFWTRAAAQGGGAGFVGDLLLGDTADSRSPMDQFGRLLLGPTFGSAADLYELTKGNIDEAAAGKDTHAGAEAVRFAKGHSPLVGLWYARAALDRLLLNGLQENLSPGYLSRIENKARKDWGQEYWWEPGEALPDRAPDLSAIGGP
jgi:hypothetical protein